MAMKQMERGGNLDVFGTREYGQDVRTQNITAVSAVANIIKSSLGPVGLDKVGKQKRKQAQRKRKIGVAFGFPRFFWRACRSFFRSLK